MKQITIQIPNNCELKQNGNTYTIVEKEKKLTYEDVAKKLFSVQCYFIDARGVICNTSLENGNNTTYDANNCTSERQAEKLLAINKLMNVAKYLNGDWQPDWEDEKFLIYYSTDTKKLRIDSFVYMQYSNIFFKSEELAQQAIEILGEETVRLALCTDY